MQIEHADMMYMESMQQQRAELKVMDPSLAHSYSQQLDGIKERVLQLDA